MDYLSDHAEKFTKHNQEVNKEASLEKVTNKSAMLGNVNVVNDNKENVQIQETGQKSYSAEMVFVFCLKNSCAVRIY